MKNHTQKKPPRAVLMPEAKRGITGSNKTVTAEDNPDLGLTPNPSAPQTPVEKNAVRCFKALEAAEHTFKEGIEFGKAMIALRDEIKGSHRGGWLDRVKQLGITYEKVRYWTAVVEGKPTQRSRAAAQAGKPKAVEAKVNGQGLASTLDTVSEWDKLLVRLHAVVDETDILMRSQPQQDYSELKKIVDELADMLGYELVKKPVQAHKKPPHKAA